MLIIDPLQSLKSEQDVCDKKRLKSLAKQKYSKSIAHLNNVFEINGNVLKGEYREQKMVQLFETFEEEAMMVVLFLKSLLKIETLCRCEDLSDQIQTLHTVSMTGSNEQLQKRTVFKNEVLELKGELPVTSLWSTYEVTMTAHNDNECLRADWIIVNYIQGTTESTEKLTSLAQDPDLSYSPYVGVAYPCVSNGTIETGHVFCFLPLPLEKKSLTGLPVHVNGLFALEQNRKHVKWGNRDQSHVMVSKDKHVLWNEMIISDVLSKAYEHLVGYLIQKSQEFPDEKDFISDVMFMVSINTVGYISKIPEFTALIQNNLLVPESKFPVPYPYQMIETSTSKVKELALALGAAMKESSELIKDVLEILLSDTERKTYNTDEVKDFMDFFLVQITTFESSILQMAKRVVFIPSSDTELYCALDLFDPRDEKLEILFHGEAKFPTQPYDSDDTLNALLKIGLKRSKDVTPDEILNSAKILDALDTENNVEREYILKAKKVKYFLNTLIIDMDINKLNELHELRWVAVSERPERYPNCLPWYSEDIGIILSTPKDVLSSDLCLLSGSVQSFVDVTEASAILEKFQWNKFPTESLILEQLNCIARIFEPAHRPELLPMVASIYNHLAKLDSDYACFKDAECILCEDTFRKPCEVYIKEGGETETFNLHPYMSKLPAEFVHLEKLFLAFGCKEILSADILKSVLEKIKQMHNKKSKRSKLKKNIRSDLQLVIQIVKYLDGLCLQDTELEDVLLPIKTKDWLFEATEEDSIEDDIFYVHKEINPNMAKRFGVPSLTNRFLTEDNSEDMVMEWGQSEPLTTRLNNLLEGYTDGFAIPKEIVQNADDAGATEVAFLYDERENKNAGSYLIDPNMAECQGPALWAYNNSIFQESDFKNIIKLGGRTKEADESTIGKFGLGFCSVYNLTDVPSFYSGNSMVIFDPHGNYLGRALKNKENPGLRMLVSSNECISTRGKEMLRKPEDLIHPQMLAASLFDEKDERFPTKLFCDKEGLDALLELGMKGDLIPFEWLKERANTIRNLSKEMALKRCKSLLEYILNCLERNDHGYNLFELADIKFLPLEEKPANWPLAWKGQTETDKDKTETLLNSENIFTCPKQLYFPKEKQLVGAVKCIVHTFDPHRYLGVLKAIGVQDVVTVDAVFKQLEIVSECTIENMRETEKEELRNICFTIYKFMNYICKDENNELEQHFGRLESQRIILTLDTEGKEILIKPSIMAFNRPSDSIVTSDCRPYLYFVDHSLKKFTEFLKKVGIREQFSSSFILGTLNECKEKFGTEPCSEKDALLVVSLIKLLFETCREEKISLSDNEMKTLIVPDEDRILRSPYDLCYDEDYGTLGKMKFMHFVHSSIDVGLMKVLGIKSKRVQHLKSFAGAMDFGQKEKLVTRLKGLLEQYPFDSTILNELLQNADDASASEIHFILDERTHPKSGVFDDSWKPLQGPSLVVYNDTCFSASDIQGIQNLGQGSKSDDPTKTGQFGLGFNATYHLTDVPSFLTRGPDTPNGGTLCIFDPHCNYAPDGDEQSIRGEWNTMILNDIIPKAYIKGMTELREYLMKLVDKRFIPTVVDNHVLVRADTFFSPFNNVCKKMCQDTEFPTPPFNEEIWRTFMEIAGMKSEITEDLFVQFAKQIEDGGKKKGVTKTVKEQSEELVFHLFRERKQLESSDLLKRIKQIKFIVPHVVPKKFLDIYPAVKNTSLICFSGSISHHYADISWTMCSLLPFYADPKYQRKDHKQIETLLDIYTQPKTENVICHAKNICPAFEKKCFSAKYEQGESQQLDRSTMDHGSEQSAHCYYTTADGCYKFYFKEGNEDIEHDINIDADFEYIEDEWLPALGSYVPKHEYVLLDNEFTEFRTGEYVAYEIYDPKIDGTNENSITKNLNDPVYIYVKVIEKCVSDTNGEATNPYLVKYKVNMGHGRKESVSVIRMYKFIRRNSTDVVEYTGKQSSYDEAREEEVMKRIRKTLIDAWKLGDEKNRKRIIKRLFLFWHPNKNKGNEEFCTKVFQYIQEIIRQLENGEININSGTGPSYSSWHFTRGSSKTYSRTWYSTFGENVNDRFHSTWNNYQSVFTNRRRNRNRHRQRTEYVYEPNPQEHEAKRWLKQAKEDLVVAIRILDCRCENLVGNDTYNWICFIAHQAAEKAIIAITFSIDANKVRREHLLSSVASAQPKETLREKAAKLDNLLGDYDSMRYPDACSFPCTPSELYDAVKAQEAVKQAQEIIEEVDDYLS
ncbi:hypothetical protein KUTeg_017430 [Tegillarca granosa]|uniref:HEPN domain-containing protein n=1 Tax=Tegillarca granosa TaxID=220873 RepID=A0ABQ9EEW8_TEGGR|nr:hypothetical protein KUTeg_017430 [Tegillarca granosa]